MRTRDRRSRPAALAALTLALLLLAAACGSDDDSSADTTTTGAASATTETTAGESDDSKFVKDVQGQLQQIGCYTGPIDGEDGPETQAAIEAFQKAAGLTVDDEVGPKTEEALKEAVASGRHDYCSGGASTSGATSTTAAHGGASTTSTTGGGGASTSTTAGGGGGNVAPCTHDAIQAALGQGETLHKWQCARDATGQDYAGGTQSASGSSDRTNFILWAKDGTWTAYTGSCDSVPQLVKEYC